MNGLLGRLKIDTEYLGWSPPIWKDNMKGEDAFGIEMVESRVL